MVDQLSAVVLKADNQCFAFKLKHVLCEDESKKNPVLHLSVFVFIHNMHHNVQIVISTLLLGFFPLL